MWHRSSVADATLLQAILDDPDDIAARRVYADALIAAGDPRGELINVQCALEDAPDRGPLAKRERELLQAHAKTWMAPYGGAIFRPVFRRGFLDNAFVNTKKFIPVARSLLDAEPITSLHLRDVSLSNAMTLGAVPGLARLRTLRVTESKLATKGTAALFTNPMPRLRNLNLYQAGIDDGGLGALGAVFPQLERLNLAGTRVTYGGLETLLGDPRLAALRYLHLNWLLPGTDGSGFLAEHLAIPSLTHLDLSSSHLANDDLRHLTTNAVFRGLRGLRAEYNSLQGAGAYEALAPLSRLEVLDLSTNTTGLDGIAALVQLDAPLRVLRLYQSKVDDEQLRVLANKRFPLKRLDLGYGSITEAGLTAIGAAGWPLEKLELWACKIGNVGAAALASSDFTATLRELSLGYNDLSDAGLEALAAATWPRLERIAFRGDGISAAGARALGAAEMPALRSIKFEDMKIPKAALKPLLERGVRVE